MRPLGVVGGSIVYVQHDGVLMAARIDVGARRVLGAPLALLDSIPVCGTCNGDSGVHLSKNGVLTYMRGSVASTLSVVDSAGLDRAIATEVRAYMQPRLAPDGRRIAVAIGSETGVDIWIYDVATQVLSRLTSGGKSNYPEWSPDGKHVVFVAEDSTGRTSIRWQTFDGGAPAETLVGIGALDKQAVRLFDGVISPDGRTLVFEALSGSGAFGIWSMPLDGDHKPRPYVVGPGSGGHPRFSPDGHWVAYASDESGRAEVYVRSFPDPSNRIQISADGGTEPVWSRDGKRIYYRNAGAMFLATVTTGTTFTVAARHRLFEKQITDSYWSASYDAAREPGQLLVLRPNADALKLVVVLNWSAELKERTSR
jgi:Tol biopolymer transport system component